MEQTSRRQRVDSGETTAHLGAAYRAIAADPKYQHFMNIPRRIILCLDHFAVDGDREVIHDRLRAYYLFIGVVDNAIDSGEIGIGMAVLKRLGQRLTQVDDAAVRSSVELVTDVLSRDLSDDLIVEKFRRLYAAVLSERAATSVAAYVHQRRVVGSLTADLSFLLIRPWLSGNVRALRRFMRQVGAVGCLVDSIIDYQADRHARLLPFKPTGFNFFFLLAHTVFHGMTLCLKNRRLLWLFTEAIADNFRDRSRSRVIPATVVRSHPEEIVASTS